MTEQNDFESTQRALLRLAPVPDPNPLRRASARRAFLEQAARLRAAAGPIARGRAAGRWFRLATALAAALGLALAGVTGVAFAADAARPGDALYPLDRGIERLQLLLSTDPQQRAALLLGMADERLQEVESLASQGDQQHMDEALESYEEIVATVSEMVGSDKGAGHQDLVDRLDEKLSAHEERLQTIREGAPEPAQPGLDRAIDAARRGHQGRPAPDPTGEATPTDDQPGNGRGRPEKTPGPPEDHPGGPQNGQGGNKDDDDHKGGNGNH